MHIAQLNILIIIQKLITLKKKTMKHFFKLVILASVITSLLFGISAFTSVKKAKPNEGSCQVSKISQKQLLIN
jgi:hypothetical protein